MDPHFMRPAAADASVVLGHPHPVVSGDTKRRLNRISECIKGVVYYGLLLFGSLFPVVATIYAIIVY